MVDEEFDVPEDERSVAAMVELSYQTRRNQTMKINEQKEELNLMYS